MYPLSLLLALVRPSTQQTGSAAAATTPDDDDDDDNDDENYQRGWPAFRLCAVGTAKHPVH